MINIKILFILPSKLKELKNYFIKQARSNRFKFISIDDENLFKEIKNTDIQIIIIDKEIGFFTKEILEMINRDYSFISFNKKVQSNVSINNISMSEIKSYKQISFIKKLLDKYNEFDSEIGLIEEIEEYLDIKIQEMEIKKEKPDIESTYLEAIKIKDYFSIKDMEIDDLKGKKEIYFVGENGDGKTVLLQAILLALKKEGEYSDLAKLYLGKEKDTMELSTIDTEYNREYKKYKNVENIFAYGINRNKTNTKESEKNLGYSALFDTPSISRTTFLREPEILLQKTSDIIKEFVKKIEDLMGSKLKILKFDNEVKFKEIDGENIEFDMLSEGYKSTLIWLCDLLSRLMENQPSIEELSQFKAIVLVDEIDLYLHPKWRYDFVFKIRQIFPNIQFIMTTHSIVTILGASEDAVFYKIFKEKGNTKISKKIDDISYYTSDILISSPLFNLDRITTRGYKDKLSNDDYVYHRIHKKIKERISKSNMVQDDKVDSWLDEEFAKEFSE